MNFFEVILIALSLSADAFAASVCKGLSLKKAGNSDCICVGLYFGIFQALMTLLGSFLTGIAAARISSYTKYISCALLFLIGANMIRQSVFGGEDEMKGNINPASMLPLAVATSIDAFAVGIAMTLQSGALTWEAGVIGAVTLILSVLGMKLGIFFGEKKRRSAGIIGGTVLIIMSIKFLF